MEELLMGRKEMTRAALPSSNMDRGLAKVLGYLYSHVKPKCLITTPRLPLELVDSTEPAMSPTPSPPPSPPPAPIVKDANETRRKCQLFLIAIII